MFCPGRKESLSSEILVDFDDEAVEGMLEFMYFHNVSMNRNSLDIFRIAHHFQLPDFATCQAEEEESQILSTLKSQVSTLLDFAKGNMGKGQERVTNDPVDNDLQKNKVLFYPCRPILYSVSWF